ncbi:MAG: hypothetical protein COA68_12280 [Oceanobacter sp.]|nr:MAG: hypothetical protein COA68_12280 [Oceanobacter sp.]
MPLPSPQGGAAFGHFAEFPARQFVSFNQTFRREFSFADGVDSLLRDLDTHRLLARQRRASNSTTPFASFPTAPVLLEGTFLSRKLAVAIARDAWLALDSEKCVVSDIVSEYAMAMVLHLECQRPTVRCGERLSTLVWSDTHRRLTGQRGFSKYEASASDIMRIRCSPFEAPFALKRFSMGKHVTGNHSDALRLLDAIQEDPRRLRRRRDALEHCEAST